MENTDIIGGVSPLKKRGQRGGKHAAKATSTKGRRGGFAKAKGKRGGGGRNVAGYNANTRFKARDPWQKPASSGPSSSSTTPPFSNGLPDNIINIDNSPNFAQIQQGTDPGTYTPAEFATRETKTEKKVAYKGSEKACHPDRKAMQIANGTFDQAKFDAECKRQKDRMAAPDYKSSGGKTVTTTGTETYMVNPAKHTPGTSTRHAVIDQRRG